jgi:TPR repeat protein
MIAHARRCFLGAFLALICLLAAGDSVIHAQDKAALYKKGIAAFEAGDFEQAYVIWKPLAENGYAVAQYSLGKLFDRGGGPIEKNAFMAALWYRQAAAQGVAAARNNLAIMYAQGRGVPANPARAVELWHQAAQQDHPMAQFNLGLSYFNGDGVEADPEAAVQWFQRAADAGVVGAQYALGQILRQGAGVPRDPERALVYYDQASRQGYEPAQQAAAELRESLGLPATPPAETAPSLAGGEPADPAEPQPAEPATQQSATAEAAPSAPREGVATAETSAEPALPQSTDVSPAAPEPRDDEEDVASENTREFIAVAPEVTTEGEVSWERLPTTPEAAETTPEPAPSSSEPIAEARLEALGPLNADAPAGASFPEADALPAAGPGLRRVDGGSQLAVMARDGADAGGSSTPPAERQMSVLPSAPAGEQPRSNPEAPRRKPLQPPSSMPSQSAATPSDLSEPQNQSEEKTKAATPGTLTEVSMSEATPVGDIDFPPGSFSIWLASTADGAAAQDFWILAADSYPNLFGEVKGSVRRVDLGEFGVYYRVLAGTWPDRDAAGQVCRRLRLKQPDAFCKIQEN